MPDINQVITDHIKTIKEPGVREWLTTRHEALAFGFSVDAIAYYKYQQQDYGCLTFDEMCHITGVLEAIQAGFDATYVTYTHQEVGDIND